MKTRQEIQTKALSIFAQMTPKERLALVGGTYPEIHMKALEGFTHGEAASVAFNLYQIVRLGLDINSLGLEHDGNKATLPMTAMEAKMMRMMRTIAELRRELGIVPPVSQGSYPEESRWNGTMTEIDKLIAEVDDKEWRPEKLAPMVG